MFVHWESKSGKVQIGTIANLQPKADDVENASVGPQSVYNALVTTHKIPVKCSYWL